MKLAVYFSGRIKGYEESLTNILKLKDSHDVTFFCSLNCSEITDYEKTFINVLDIQESQLIYKVVEIPEWVFTADIKDNCVTRENAYSHFFNNQQCFKLIEEYQKKNHMTFDCIIKYRGDIISHEPLPLLPIEPTTIYIPECNDYGGINDQIAYGDFETMKIYSYLCSKIPFYSFDEGTAYHPESLTQKNLLYNNLNIKRFPFWYTLSNNRF